MNKNRIKVELFTETVAATPNLFSVITETGKLVINNINLESPNIGSQVRFCKMRNINTKTKEIDFFYKQI